MANNITSFLTPKIIRYTTVKLDEMHKKFIINKRLLKNIMNSAEISSISSTSMN